MQRSGAMWPRCSSYVGPTPNRIGGAPRSGSYRSGCLRPTRLCTSRGVRLPAEPTEGECLKPSPHWHAHTSRHVLSILTVCCQGPPVDVNTHFQTTMPGDIHPPDTSSSTFALGARTHPNSLCPWRANAPKSICPWSADTPKPTRNYRHGSPPASPSAKREHPGHSMQACTS